MTLKVGERSTDSRVYECSSCGNVKVLMSGEKAPYCEICDGKKHHWNRTPKEILFRTKDVHKEIERKKSRTDRVSDSITWFCGNMVFVYVHAIWFAWWIIYNIYAPNAFDPYPFNFLTLVVSLEAIVLATFILISQNRQAEVSEFRSELDYQTNVKSEKEIAEILALQREIYEEVTRKKKRK